MSLTYNPLSGNLETKEPGPQGPAGTVSAAGDGSEGAPSISFASQPNTGLYKYASESIAVSTGGTGKLFIDSNGRVGIGTTPGNTLHLAGASGVGTRVQNTSNSLNVYQTFEGTEFRNNISGTGAFTWYTGGGEKFRVDNNGNIGVNTTSPGDLVEVKTGLDRSLLIRGNRTSAPVDLFAGNPAAGYGLRDMSFSANSITFGTGSSSGTTASPQMRLTSTGRLGLGTSSPGTKLTIGGEDNPTLRIHTAENGDNWSTSSQYGKLQFYSNDYEYNSGGEMASISVGVNNNFGQTSSLRFSTTTSRSAGAVPTERMRLQGSALLLGGTLPASPNINLNAGNGSASFAGGDVTIDSNGRYNATNGNNSVTIAEDGFISLQRDASNENSYLFRGAHKMGGSSMDNRFVVWGDGSTGIGGTLNATSFAGSSPNITLKADGTGSFAGTVFSNRATQGYAFEASYSGSTRGGLFASVSGSSLFLKDSSGTNKVALSGVDGSATFASGVTGDYFATNTTAGFFNFYRNQGGSSAINTAWGDSGGAQKIKFFNNGSASFTGFVTEAPVTNYYTSATPTTGDTNGTGTWATNASTAPDGTRTASKFTASSPSASSRFGQISSSVNLNSTAYTLSFYAKSESGSNQTISVDLGDSSGTSITVTTSWQRFVLTSLVPVNGRFIDFGGIDGNWSLWGVQIQTEPAATSYVKPSGGVATTSASRATVGTRFSDYSDFFVAGDAEIDGNVSVNDALTKLVRNNNIPLNVKRLSSDGKLVTFLQDNTEEGDISVSGSTVSLNGAHLTRWSQLADGAERTEILRGSVLSNLDEMCEWQYGAQAAVLYTEEDELPEGVNVGDVKVPAVEASLEDNEQLNRMKVSDVEGDRNVAGVFQSWDDDDDTYTNDFYCAMTGDFVIRIAQGTTVARGDLLMSAGDGTAKPQDDDIVRSKTIAKVTSTVVSETYSDGSYCVPCVLMAC